LIAFFASLILIHESDMISGEPGGFHCSSIGSIVIGDVGCGDSVDGVDGVDEK
jgi:hypothetical protein